jgi:protein-tyrosine phosphatase
MAERIQLNGLNNTRDLCGIIGADGRKIRPGKLIRSGHLYYADESDRKKLSQLTEVIVDFRTEREREEKPDPELPDVEAVWLPILTESGVGISREKETDRKSMTEMMRDPDAAREQMCSMYRMIGSSSFCALQYEQFIRLLLKEHKRAVLWHCTAGKDRAGFGTVLIEELLGVDRETIFEDYLMTNVYLNDEINGLIVQLQEMMKSAGPVDETAMRILFGAEKEYLDALYQAIEETFGGMERYLHDTLHISEAERDRLRAMYLE